MVIELSRHSFKGGYFNTVKNLVKSKKKGQVCFLAVVTQKRRFSVDLPVVCSAPAFRCCITV